MGNIVKGNATMVDDDYNLIEMPMNLLPTGTETRGIVKITITREEGLEKKRD